MQKRFDNINATFEDYENNFMQPTQMREGRMHAIETKLREQEDARQIEYNHTKKLIKSVLNALEQSAFVHGSTGVAETKQTIALPSNQVQISTPSVHNALNLIENQTNETLNAMDIKGNRTVTSTTPHKFLPSLSHKYDQTNMSFHKQPISSKFVKYKIFKNFKILTLFLYRNAFNY